MSTIKAFSLSFWTAVVIIAALNIIVFSLLIMTSVDDLKVQYIPDDAYYYLTLSRNFSSLGIWTFDSGISVTSGFHLLFAYLLSSLFLLLDLNTNSFVTYGLILSALFALASISVMCFWGRKQKNVLFLMFFVLVISSRNFVYNTVSLTEWSLTILIASLYCVWFFTNFNNPVIKIIDFLVLFMFGLLGSLARSDFGLFPFSIALATFVFFLFIRTSKRKLLFAFVGLMGTLTGLLVVLIHNYIFTNEILQSSAKMKTYWAQLEPPNYYEVLFLIEGIIGLTGLLLLALLIVSAIFPKFIRKKDIHSSTNEDQQTHSHDSMYSFYIMLVSAGICILGYTLFYSRNGAIQPWYTANLIIPILMLIFAISDYITVSLHEQVKFLFLLLFLSTLIFNISNLYPISMINAPWPHQKFMFDAGVYLKENIPNCRIGAWNAGIIGYYQGGHIVNLDGLVNNDIYTYAVNNDLPAYLSSRAICYVIDFENMLTFEPYRVRGGYDDTDFLVNLKPLMVFDSGEYAWRYLTLYYIDNFNGPN